MQTSSGMGDLSAPMSFPNLPIPAPGTQQQGIPPPSQQVSQQQQQQPMTSSASSILPNSAGVPVAPPAEGAQQFCLRWNSYPATVATQLATLRAAEDFVDVTLACDGRQLKAHKLVLSACSPYFMQLFKSTPCQHPVIFLRDVGFRQLVALLEFMYAGEVNVSQVELPALLRTAEALQVRGLADTTANNNNNNNNNICPPQQKPTFSPHYGQIVGPPVMNPTPPPPQVPLDQSSSNGCTSIENPVPIPTPQLFNNPQPVAATSVPSSSSSSSAIPNTSVPNKKERNSSPEGGKPTAEDEDSESNDSNDFDMMEQLDEHKTEDYLADGDLSGQLEDTGQIFPDPNDVAFEMNDADIGDDPLGEVPQSGEETSEEESDDDGECKEFTYQSDASIYSQEGIGDLGEGVGNPNGENMAGPSGLERTAGVDHPGGSTLKGEGGGSGSSGPGGGGGSGGSGRNRLSRSLWPPGIPYHGPQQCPYCPRVLSNVGNWRKHVLTMHFAREKVYKCRHCSSAFRTAEYLQKHYVRVHNYPQKMTRRKYSEQT